VHTRQFGGDVQSFSGVEVEIARIAARQHRIVTGAQLRGVGLSHEAIRFRVERCRLLRLWRDIYVLGPASPDTLSLAFGAVLATAGVLSHRWAGWLWGFVETVTPPIDVSVMRGSHRGRRGIVVHQARSLDTTRKRGIPVTTPAQTCLDLAAVVEPGELERIIAEAQVKNVLRESHLHDVIARNPRRPGVAVLKAILADGPQYTAAESERRMLSLARMADLPRPETNAGVLRYRADFRWRDQKLIVEIDGFATHGHRRAFENDRRRNAELVAAGYRVMQITWRQLTDEPIAVAARIAAALARGDAA
jgi:very-short-patch-repair endonuclease